MFHHETCQADRRIERITQHRSSFQLPSVQPAACLHACAGEHKPERAAGVVPDGLWE